MSENSASGFQLGEGVADRYQAYVEPFQRPFVEALIEAVVRPGQKVLDIACGTGFATRAAARVVGADGSVDGADINPRMIEAARRNSPGLTIGWHTASALELPFEDDLFDVVICQQGVQFFPSPADGLREMRRVVRPGGTLGATVWGPLSMSPYLDALTTLPDRSPMAPGELHQLSRMDGDAELHSWATAAGWKDVEVATVERPVELPPLRTQFVNHLSALPWSSTFFALSPEDQSSALDALLEPLNSYVQPDGTAKIPTTSYLVIGVA